jgi:4-hydroxy-2-oxoglutarate aldolase
MWVMKLHGIFAPLTSSFAANGSLAFDGYRENLVRYNRTRLAGYIVNGSTSESVLLGWNEVYSIWETARKYASPEKILVAGTGAEATAETIEHTRRAASIGFAAALVRTPSFYKPAISSDLLATHYLRVADASPLPVLLYSVPIFTHVQVDASLVSRVASHPNILGIKDSSGDIAGLSAIIAAAPKSFQTLVGSTSTLFESLQAGAVGAILAVANAFPELCCEIYEACCAGDSARARSLADRLSAAGKLFGARFGISGLKYALDCLGYYGGPPRPPLLPVSEDAKREIEAALPAVSAELSARSK